MHSHFEIEKIKFTSFSREYVFFILKKIVCVKKKKSHNKIN